MVFGWSRNKRQQVAEADLLAPAAWDGLTPPTLPKGPLKGFHASASLQNSNVAVVNAEARIEARADVIFGLLADPNKHATIFEAIEGAKCRLLAEDGPWRKYELDYQARWKFWRVGGVCENKLYMETHADEGTVSFKLREPGFLRVYEGTWVISPAGMPALNLHTRQQQQQQLQQPGGRVQPLLRLNPQADVPDSPSSSTTSSGASSPRPPWSGLFDGLALPPLTPGGVGRVGPLASINSPLLALQQHMGSLQLPRGSPTSSRRSSLDDGSSPTHRNSRMEAEPLVPSGPGTATQGGVTSTPVAVQGVQGVVAAQHYAPMPSHSVVRVQGLRVCPKITPPYPLAGLLKGHAVGQVEDMLKGLLAAAQQLQAQELNRQPPPTTNYHASSPTTVLNETRWGGRKSEGMSESVTSHSGRSSGSFSSARSSSSGGGSGGGRGGGTSSSSGSSGGGGSSGSGGGTSSSRTTLSGTGSSIAGRSSGKGMASHSISVDDE